MPVSTNAVLVARLYAKYSFGYSSLDRSVMGFFRWEGTHRDRSCTQVAMSMRTPCLVRFWQSHIKLSLASCSAWRALLVRCHWPRCLPGSPKVKVTSGRPTASSNLSLICGGLSNLRSSGQCCSTADTTSLYGCVQSERSSSRSFLLQCSTTYLTPAAVQFVKQAARTMASTADSARTPPE
jgi:hypothetical protein